MITNNKWAFSGGVLSVMFVAFLQNAFCLHQRDDFKVGVDLIDEIKQGHFEAVIEEEASGSMRVKKKYKTPEIKEALYQLLANPPKGFWSNGEGLPGVYLL
jgi:hypothetical protein